MAAKRVHHTIHWFRKGLRLHDNPALREAYDTSLTVRPVYILDPDLVKCGQIGVVRWRFILQSLEDLDQSLRQINSRLLVIQGRPSEVFADLFKKWEITKLTFEVDTDALAKARDEEVIKLASQANVEVVQKVSHTLFDLDAILAKNLGTAPLTYKSFQAVVSTLGAPDEPLPAVDRYITHGCKLPIDDEHDRYSIPTIDDLGLSIPEESSEVLYPGGEVEALRRMNEYMAKQDWVCKFEKPSTSPNSIEPSTTVLSPYLALGCLSVRLFYKKIQEIYSKAKKHSQPPVSLHGQLLWREFFSTCAHNTPNFNKMEGNRVCLQIPWDKNDDHLKAWSTGCTGFPFIDAIMIKLRKEGWIHHLARHAVACFLTRGDLWISWEEGLKVFENLLIDHDWSLNAGNWMWLSASAFFHAYFRVYSPIAFGKKTDPNGDFIRKYLPVLKRFPAKYIYDPWNSPLSVQQAAGCVIGKDYPKPIVDHNKAVTKNLARMKQAREAKYGSKQAANVKKSPPKRKRSSEKTNGKVRKITDFTKS